MLTNTFLPHVGGVARSVQRFAEEFRRRGHRVLVVAPEYGEPSAREPDVIRIPALRNFNGSDFSLPVPISRCVGRALKSFEPGSVHSHQPCLLGVAALRVAASRGPPVVFTHHSRYEDFTHYVPGDSPRLKRFVRDLVTGYCNLCDAVIAPSETVAALLARRGVNARIEVIPTGLDLKLFSGGDRASCRARYGIPQDAFVVGHVGRLAREKNLWFLANAVSRFLLRNEKARFLLVGDGPMRDAIYKTFESRGPFPRLQRDGRLCLRLALGNAGNGADRGDGCRDAGRRDRRLGSARGGPRPRERPPPRARRRRRFRGRAFLDRRPFHGRTESAARTGRADRGFVLHLPNRGPDAGAVRIPHQRADRAQGDRGRSMDRSAETPRRGVEDRAQPRPRGGRRRDADAQGVDGSAGGIYSQERTARPWTPDRTSLRRGDPGAGRGPSSASF